MAVCLIAVTGCAEDVPQRAGTLDDPSATAGTGDEGNGTSAEKEETDFSRAGRKLTKKEAKAALPAASILPAGWSVDPENTLNDEDEDDDSDDTYRPQRCAPVFDALDDSEDKKAAAEAGVTFTSGMLGPWLAVNISSYEDEVPEGSFEQVLTALSNCPTFSVDDGESVTKVQAAALSFPNFGEESAALRLNMKSEGMAFGMDVVMVRVGHNQVSVIQAGMGGTGSVKPLQKAAKATMANLNR